MTKSDKEIPGYHQLSNPMVSSIWSKICEHWVTIFISLALGLSLLSSWWSYNASQNAQEALQNQCETRIIGLRNNRAGWYKLLETFPALKDRPDMQPFIQYLDDSVKVHCVEGTLVKDNDR